MPPPRREPHFFTACVSDPGGRRCRAATDADYLRRFLRLENATAGGLAHATYDASADYAAVGAGGGARVPPAAPPTLQRPTLRPADEPCVPRSRAARGCRAAGQGAALKQVC
jgi:hypothetical protein